MRRPHFPPPRNNFRSLVFGVVASICSYGNCVAAEKVPTPLQLDVLIDGYRIDLIASFFQLPNRRIASTKRELHEIGINLPAGVKGDLVPLDEIAGLTYRYDEPKQAIDISVPNDIRVGKAMDARPSMRFYPPTRSYGAYVNYSAFIAGKYETTHSKAQMEIASLDLEGNIFGRYGTLSLSGILSTLDYAGMRFMPLNTTWSYSDPSRIITYRAGDMIASGLAFTRPIRLGGLQVERDYGIRPDIVTMPLPSFGGSIAVPSTLDVYVNNVKTYSSQLSGGPFQVNNIPVISGMGAAELVLTDINGRQTRSQLPFLASAQLLDKGLKSYSAEVGFPRLEYGLRGAIYDVSPVATASYRAGVTSTFTFESHGEFGHGLINASVGGLVTASRFGLLSATVGMSKQRSDVGTILYGAWDLPYGDFSLHASIQRTLGDYKDLASLSYGSATLGSRFPSAVDEFAVSYHTPFSRFSVSLSGIHSDSAQSGEASLLSLSLGGTFENGLSLYASGYHDFSGARAFGISAGLVMALDQRTNVSSDMSGGDGVAAFTAQISRMVDLQPGSYGGRLAIRAGEQLGFSGYGAARLREGLFEGSISKQGQSVNGYLQFSGSLVSMGHEVFAAPRIDDAFAVVDAGASNVGVMLEHRPVGRTGRDGKILIAGLNAYQQNRITIDGSGLPVDAEIPVTELKAVPAARNGVMVKFGAHQTVPSAVVIFIMPDGSFVKPGSRGRIDGSPEEFVVGYDGRTFIRNLRRLNIAVLTLEDQKCEATVPFEKKPNTQVTVGPVTCHPFA